MKKRAMLHSFLFLFDKHAWVRGHEQWTEGVEGVEVNTPHSLVSWTLLDRMVG